MSAITSLVSGISGASAAKKQAKQLRIKEAAEREANRVDKKKNALKVQREKVASLREARIKRAQIIQGAVNAGARYSGTSSAMGATGSIASQYGQNTGMLNQFEGFGDRLSALSQQSADALSKYNRIGAKQAAFAGMMKGIGGIGDAAISFAGGFGAMGAGAAGGGGLAAGATAGGGLAGANAYAGSSGFASSGGFA